MPSSPPNAASTSARTRRRSAGSVTSAASTSTSAPAASIRRIAAIARPARSVRAAVHRQVVVPLARAPAARSGPAAPACARARAGEVLGQGDADAAEPAGDQVPAALAQRPGSPRRRRVTCSYPVTQRRPPRSATSGRCRVDRPAQLGHQRRDAGGGRVGVDQPTASPGSSAGSTRASPARVACSGRTRSPPVTSPTPAVTRSSRTPAPRRSARRRRAPAPGAAR